MNKFEKLYETDGNFLRDINHDNPDNISIIPKSMGFISPGDVLSFSYPGSGRVFVFVVKVKRGHGVFMSGRGNLLLACFKLTSASPQISSRVLKTLYKNRRSASYANVQRGLLAIFGSNSFRTYNLGNIGELTEVSIQVKQLPLEDED